MQGKLPPKDPSEQLQDLSQKRRRVVFNAVLMSLGTLLTRVFGLLREALFAAYFPRTLTDAWYVAFRLPNLFRRLFGEGSLSVSFVPVFVEAHMADSKTDADFVRSKNLVNAFYTLFLIFLAGLSVAGVIFSDQVASIMVDPEFKAIPGKFEMTVRMSQIMFSYIFLVCTYAYFMAILNALGSFGWAAAAPVFMNIALIVGTLIPTQWLSWDGQAISWAVIIGGVLQAGVLVPHLWKKGFFPKFQFDLRNPDVHRVLKGMAPGLIGLGLLQFTTIINTRFASSLGEGPVSYIFLADRLLELPLSLVSVSLGTALLPVLSELWSQNASAEFKKTVNYNLRLNILLSGAAGTGLYMLALPIVNMLFQRGKFTPDEAMITAEVVQVYALLVVTSSCVRVLVPSFYAIRNTWLPALVSGVCLVIHIVVAPILMERWGLFGLNFSSVVTAGLNLLLLLFCFQWLFGGMGYGQVISSIFKSIFCCLMLALGLKSHAFLIGFFGVTLGGQILAFLAATFVGLCLFLLAGWVVRMQEMTVIMSRLIEKIKSRIAKA